RKKQIIESAMRVFKEKGFKGTTTAEIAESAKITEVTLFRYFSSKQEVYLEGVKPFIVKTLEEVVETSSSLTPKERLQAILLDRITFISENYETIKLILNESPELSGMGVDLSSEIRKIIEKSIMQAPIKDEMRPQAVRLIMGSLLSFLYMPEKNPERIRNYVYQITDMLMSNMRGENND
ncbi:MAG TPA: TetR/AcrR family transcriptional regulator, partial [Bacteroidales bacterium]|nr:TetR/AcrR family transcriptional regulator [Bacteroidales bacterium]